MGERIEIPFRDDMRALIIEGRKTATSRRQMYGVPGDWFEIKDPMTGEPHRYELASVERMVLWHVRDFHFQEEGFKSPDAFRKTWVEIHPGAGFQSTWKVWFHTFKEAPA